MFVFFNYNITEKSQLFQRKQKKNLRKGQSQHAINGCLRNAEDQHLKTSI